MLKTILAACSVAALTWIGIGAGRAPDQPPADFAFKFDYTPCTTDTLDTFSNLYSRQLGVDEPPISISLAFNDDQMAAVYDALSLSGDVPRRHTG